jgi:magnesium-transporting ATPase (P-type)
MITGDNIFIAIETAARVGIIKKDEPIILLEGAKQVKTNEDDGGEEIVYLGTLLKREDEEVTHEEIKVKNTEYMDQDFCMAMDGSFLNLEPSPPIPSRACIFARVPPEDKANIIKKLKKRIK